MSANLKIEIFTPFLSNGLNGFAAEVPENIAQGAKSTEQKTEIKSIPIWQHLLTLAVSPHVTKGLAKIFNFEVLQHGTSITNSYGILKNGGDPSKGASESGSTHGVKVAGGAPEAIENCKDHFYVFKDSEQVNAFKDAFKNSEQKENQSKSKDFLIELGVGLMTALSVRMHAVFAGISHTNDIQNRVVRIAAKIFHGISNFFFSPTLMFIYTLDETKNIFESDPEPNYRERAYRTNQKLPNNRIGLIGVCKQVSQERFNKNLNERPMRVLAGVVQVVGGTILTCTGLGWLI